MGKTESKSKRKGRPALTPEARELQLINLAMDAAEEQLLSGTASSQVITHFLKLGSTKERIEKEILLKQKDLLAAKTQSINDAKDAKELYKEAIKAMRDYRGSSDEDDQNIF